MISTKTTEYFVGRHLCIRSIGSSLYNTKLKLPDFIIGLIFIHEKVNLKISLLRSKLN